MAQEQNSIFEFGNEFNVASPLGNWMEARTAELEADRELLNTTQSEDDVLTYEEEDYFVFNADRLFLIRDYQDDDEKVLWSSDAVSGNGKYLNKPEHVDKKYDPDKKLGGPIPPGWYYVDLSDFTANKNSSDKKIKKGTAYKGYQPDRSGGGWGSWAKPLYNYFWDFSSRYSRDGFFLHEDGGTPGSGGCIATTKKSKGIETVKKIVKQAYDLGLGHIYVHVNYDYVPPIQNIYHKVVDKDTLYKLSKKYGVTQDAIRKANGMKSNETVILKGSTLVIPIIGCN